VRVVACPGKLFAGTRIQGPRFGQPGKHYVELCPHCHHSKVHDVTRRFHLAELEALMAQDGRHFVGIADSESRGWQKIAELLKRPREHAIVTRVQPRQQRS